MVTLKNTIVALIVISTSAEAQDLSSDTFDARGYVADLNVIAANWTEGELSNADAAVIAAVGCGLVRKIAADDLLGNAAHWIDVVGYPEPGEVEETSMEEFVAFEVVAFKTAGATDATLDLLQRTLWERVSLSVEPPAFEMELVEASGAEQRYCNARMINGADPSAAASDTQVLLASSTLDSALGASMIAVDAFVSVGSAGADAGFIAILSGGVGYDLLKRGLGG